MKAWHFVSDTLTLRDGRPVPPDGEVLVHTGPLALCTSGLHASRRILDALKYAPGSTICRVEVGGTIIHATDKVVATERTILWRVDGAEVLRKAARRYALDVADLWDMPDVVRAYLRTGNPGLQLQAEATWSAAAESAAESAAAAEQDWQFDRLVLWLSDNEPKVWPLPKKRRASR